MIDDDSIVSLATGASSPRRFRLRPRFLDEIGPIRKHNLAIPDLLLLRRRASGDPAQEIEEAERKLSARLHRMFKVKIGAQTPQADMARMQRLAEALEGRAELIVDANQAWDETVARRYLPQLAEMGVRLVEQPVPAWNVPGLSRLRAGAGGPPLLADECVFTPHDMLAVAAAAAADAVSLKLVKHGGMLGLRRVAAVAEAAGIGL